MNYRFLVEGSKGAILHTGDFRAEPWFLNSLMHNPYLQPYIASPTTVTSSTTARRTGIAQVKALDAIYLDTACLLQQSPVPTKDHATSGLLELIELYPPETCLFINSWTWGYEDVLKAISRAHGCKVMFKSARIRVNGVMG